MARCAYPGEGFPALTLGIMLANEILCLQKRSKPHDCAAVARVSRSRRCPERWQKEVVGARHKRVLSGKCADVETYFRRFGAQSACGTLKSTCYTTKCFDWAGVCLRATITASSLQWDQGAWPLIYKKYIIVYYSILKDIVVLYSLFGPGQDWEQKPQEMILRGPIVLGMLTQRRSSSAGPG